MNNIEIENLIENIKAKAKHTREYQILFLSINTLERLRSLGTINYSRLPMHALKNAVRARSAAAIKYLLENYEEEIRQKWVMACSLYEDYIKPLLYASSNKMSDALECIDMLMGFTDNSHVKEFFARKMVFDLVADSATNEKLFNYIYKKYKSIIGHEALDLEGPRDINEILLAGIKAGMRDGLLGRAAFLYEKVISNIETLSESEKTELIVQIFNTYAVNMIKYKVICHRALCPNMSVLEKMHRHVINISQQYPGLVSHSDLQAYEEAMKKAKNLCESVEETDEVPVKGYEEFDKYIEQIEYINSNLGNINKQKEKLIDAIDALLGLEAYIKIMDEIRINYYITEQREYNILYSPMIKEIAEMAALIAVNVANPKIIIFLLRNFGSLVKKDIFHKILDRTCDRNWSYGEMYNKLLNELMNTFLRDPKQKDFVKYLAGYAEKMDIRPARFRLYELKEKIK